MNSTSSCLGNACQQTNAVPIHQQNQSWATWTPGNTRPWLIMEIRWFSFKEMYYPFGNSVLTNSIRQICIHLHQLWQGVYILVGSSLQYTDQLAFSKSTFSHHQYSFVVLWFETSHYNYTEFYRPICGWHKWTDVALITMLGHSCVI